MRLGLLTQYYPPEMGAPQARLSELAVRFVGRGHDVTVLTAMPNYPTGRIFPGYGGWLRRESQAGVRIIRTFIYPVQSAGLLPRLTSYFSFVSSSAVVGAACLGRLDYLMVESPPLFLGLAGVWLARMTGARLIFNVSDLWPESAVRLGLVRRGSAQHRWGQWLERWCYQRAWLISGQSREIVADIAQRFPEARTYHLSNGVDTGLFDQGRAQFQAGTRLGAPGECIALYAGLHGIAQGLDQLVAAAPRLPPALRIVLVGEGPDKSRLVDAATKRGVQNVVFLPPVPHREIPGLLASADIILVPLRTALPGAVPSKLYEAMASSRPVVLVATGEPAEIVRDNGAGEVVAPGDIDGLASALGLLATDPARRRALGENGRRAACRLFDREVIVAGYAEYLERQLAASQLEVERLSAGNPNE